MKIPQKPVLGRIVKAFKGLNYSSEISYTGFNIVFNSSRFLIIHLITRSHSQLHQCCIWMLCYGWDWRLDRDNMKLIQRQTINVDSTLKPRRWINVRYSTLIQRHHFTVHPTFKSNHISTLFQRWGLTLIQRWNARWEGTTVHRPFFTEWEN